MLYNFNKLRKLIERVAPISATQSKRDFLVEGEDFTQKHNNGEVEYTDEGIFVIINGKRYQRYIYKKYYYVTYGNTPPSFPKFHFIECSTLRETSFIKDYYSANTESVLVIDKQTRKEYPNQVLDICKNCLREAIVDVPVDTKEFFKQKNEEAKKTEIVPTDIFGYTYDWDEISKNYRAMKKLTCERCSLQVKKGYDELYLHVHHVNGDKTYNHTDNLECLCVLCHSDVDAHHTARFSKQRMQDIISEFLKSYRNQIRSKNNRLYKEFREKFNKN